MFHNLWHNLWLLLTYTYNVVLVLFIATHLFVGAIISFLMGMYMGVYLSQNFEVPRINEPRVVWEKLLGFLERNRRDPKKVSVGYVLRPSTIKELVVVGGEADFPSKTEAIFVPESRNSATFVQAGSQTELELFMYRGEDQITPMSSLECEFGEKPEDIINPTVLANSPTNPITTDNASTLILTEPEDLTEQFRMIALPQIVEASLTLDKNRAVTRSSTSLN